MQKVFCLKLAFNGPLSHFFSNSKYLGYSHLWQEKVGAQLCCVPTVHLNYLLGERKNVYLVPVPTIWKNSWPSWTIKNIDMSILQQSDSKFTSVLLISDTSFNKNKNTFILDATIDNSILNRRFGQPLFNSSWLAFVSIVLKMKSCPSIQL